MGCSVVRLGVTVSVSVVSLVKLVVKAGLLVVIVGSSVVLTVACGSVVIICVMSLPVVDVSDSVVWPVISPPVVKLPSVLSTSSLVVGEGVMLVVVLVLLVDADEDDSVVVRSSVVLPSVVSTSVLGLISCVVEGPSVVSTMSIS